MASNTTEVPEDFHALYDAGTRAARDSLLTAESSGRTAGHEELAAEVPGLAVDYDEATGLPNRVAVTAPDGRLSDSADSAEEAAERFVRNRRDLWNLSEEGAAGVEVTSVSGKGLTTVQMVQRVDGVDVFGSELTAAVSGDNQVLSVAGRLFPGVVRTDRRGSGVTPTEDAIARAVLDLTGIERAPSAFAAMDASEEQYRYYTYTPAQGRQDNALRFDRPVRVKDVVFPLGERVFADAYYIELWVRGYPAFGYVIDSADDPDVLFRKNFTADGAVVYRVFNTGDGLLRPEDGPAPGSPHPTGKPDGFQAPTIVQRDIKVESLLPDEPWLPSGAETTEGNNCVAYADLSGPDGLGPGDVMGTVSKPGMFKHTYDFSKPASEPTNLQATLAGMFFHVNWLHDRWYEAGFDEAAGNAQQDNFGRGGLGGDPVLAEGHDFSGTDNANMSTPPDGASPRMQMYEFVGVEPRPSRTSNFEALITFHEMGHYITNRLVGNATGLTNRQGKAMGEGWGDWFAVTMTSQETDDLENGVFAVGGWTDLTPTFDDNYYYSIRRYPYSADMTKSPLTFKHISNSVILPIGAPRNPNSGGSNSEVHNAGEVWCTALWEVTVNLVAKHGHHEADRRVLEYVVGGLKLTPNQPTFTQARDGVITAVTALDAGDLPEVWAGFAKRGMGVDAISPPSSSTSLSGVVESFDTPSDLA